MSLPKVNGSNSQVSLKDFVSAKRKALEHVKRRAGLSSKLLHVGRWVALVVLLEVLRLSLTRRIARPEAPERAFARVVLDNNRLDPVAQGGRGSKEYFPKPAKGSRKQTLHVITSEELEIPRWKKWVAKARPAAARDSKVQPANVQPLLGSGGSGAASAAARGAVPKGLQAKPQQPVKVKALDPLEELQELKRMQKQVQSEIQEMQRQ